MSNIVKRKLEKMVYTIVGLAFTAGVFYGMAHFFPDDSIARLLSSYAMHIIGGVGSMIGYRAVRLAKLTSKALHIFVKVVIFVVLFLAVRGIVIDLADTLLMILI